MPKPVPKRLPIVLPPDGSTTTINNNQSSQPFDTTRESTLKDHSHDGESNNIGDGSTRCPVSGENSYSASATASTVIVNSNMEETKKPPAEENRVCDASMKNEKNHNEKKAVIHKPPIDPVKTLSFPAKLHAMLSQKIYNDVISWMPHGRSWRIHKPKLFEVKVLPRFFVQCKYSSFIRQANGWGFRRVTKGPDRNSYWHKFFLRGRLKLCHKMFRPGTSKKKASQESENEPDFSRMSQIEPLPEVEDIVQPEGYVADILALKKRLNDQAKSVKSMPFTSGMKHEAYRDISELFAAHQRNEYVALVRAQASLEQRLRHNMSFNHMMSGGHPDLGAALIHEADLTNPLSGVTPAYSVSSSGVPSCLPSQQDFDQTSMTHQSQHQDNAVDLNDSIDEGQTSSRLQELMEMSQYFRSRRGDYEGVIVNNRMSVRHRHDPEDSEHEI